MNSTEVLAFVLAGGKGTRLYPLTAEHAAPALPFAAGYRIIDFVLSNLVNSGISTIYVLAQYKPRSLIDHISAAWAPRREGERVIKVVLPETTFAAGLFRGATDAVYQNLHLIERHRPDLVAVFAADHVYRMDVRQMASFHRQNDAEVSVAAVRVPIGDGSKFGIIVTARNGRIEEFQERPEQPAAIPGDRSHAYASMGNYLFNPRVLQALLEEARLRGDTDFGKHLMPHLPGKRRVFAYDFASNRVPGTRPYEERGYWRDVGTLDTFVAAQRDVLDPLPRLSLDNPEWPIRGGGYHVQATTANRPRQGEGTAGKGTFAFDQQVSHA